MPMQGGTSGLSHFHLRLAAFIVIAVVVLGTTVVLLQSPAMSHAPAEAIAIRTDMWGFWPSAIEAKAGKPITLHLINPDSEFHADGGGNHQFAIPELGIDVIIPPRSDRVVTFTPTVPGTYTFYCDVCCGGKENPAMRGTLTVTS